MRNRLLLMARKKPTPGYVALYDMTNVSGQTLADLSGNGFTGTLGSTTGSDTHDPTLTSTGLAFAFDDYVDVGLPNRCNASAGTAWTAMVVCSSVTGGTIMGRSAGNTPGVRTFTIRSISAKLYVNLRGTDNDCGAYPAATTNSIAVTWDGAAAKLYVNGAYAQDLTAGTYAVEADSVPVGFGHIGTTANYLSGTINAAAIYPTDLLPSQIAKTHAYWRWLLARKGVTLV